MSVTSSQQQAINILSILLLLQQCQNKDPRPITSSVLEPTASHSNEDDSTAQWQSLEKSEGKDIAPHVLLYEEKGNFIEPPDGGSQSLPLYNKDECEKTQTPAAVHYDNVQVMDELELHNMTESSINNVNTLDPAKTRELRLVKHPYHMVIEGDLEHLPVVSVMSCLVITLQCILVFVDPYFCLTSMLEILYNHITRPPELVSVTAIKGIEKLYRQM